MLTYTLIDFVKSVGINVRECYITEPTFLSGLQLKDGVLLIDTDKLLYPGDILHEAGHLATMPPCVRETMSDTLQNNDLNQGGEMMAIAWSFAACVHLELDPRIVFHPEGYNGGSESIVENFINGRYFGVPLLQWAGMAHGDKMASEFNTRPYPSMLCWVREN